MNLVLILRCEFVCVVVLGFILWYSLKYGVKDGGKHFFRILACAIGHTVFDFITVITVNNLNAFPPWLNFTCHIIFYLFAIFYCCELFRYVIDLTLEPEIGRRLYRISLAVPAFYAIIVLVLPIEYLTGTGTNYSFGPSAILGYMLAVAIFLVSEILLLFHMDRVPDNAKLPLIPGFILMSASVALQVIYPELLYTGASVTIMTGALFFAVADPAAVYRRKAYFDTASGVKNRNCYIDEMDKLRDTYGQTLGDHNFICLTCDLNGLKRINDTFGHAVGDEYILTAAALLKKTLKSAYGVYRMGGDEFVAVYCDGDPEQAMSEIREAERLTGESRMKNGESLSVSYGMAVAKNGEDAYKVVKRADMAMFEEKKAYHSKNEKEHRI